MMAVFKEGTALWLLVKGRRSEDWKNRLLTLRGLEGRVAPFSYFCAF
jgi:hypothetical protein